jgi:hypothetical protein
MVPGRNRGVSPCSSLRGVVFQMRWTNVMNTRLSSIVAQRTSAATFGGGWSQSSHLADDEIPYGGREAVESRSTVRRDRDREAVGFC